MAGVWRGPARWLLARRLRVVLATAAALLALDLARSGVARGVYAHPASGLWTPTREEATAMRWPPARNLEAGASSGRRVYVERCAVCHGLDGRGNGPAAPSLWPRPRDFTLGEAKFKSTRAGSPPTDEDLRRTVRAGLTGTAMPGFSDLLSPDQLEAVLAEVKAFSHDFGGARPVPLQPPPAPPPTAQGVARGRALYVSKGCVSCHEADLRGGRRIPDESGAPTEARDLTAPWGFRGGADRAALWLRLTTGISPGPMPAYEDALTAAERWDLVDFVLASARIPPWEPAGAFGGPGASADPAVRGEYLVRWGLCGLCHTEIDATGIYRADRFLAGGMRITAGPHGVFVSRNLTSDEQTGLGRWEVAQIARALRDGQTPDRALNPFAMLWPAFHAYGEDDATAIATHLQSRLPPVENRIPPPVRYGLLETVLGKLTRPLPAASPRALTYAEGNFALPGGAGPPGRWLRALVWAQWAVLALGLVLWLLAGPSGRRLPRGARGWGRWAGGAAGLLVLAGLLWALERWPALRGLPPGPIVAGFSRGRVHPEVRALAPAQARLVARGETIFAVTCAVCHTPDGAGGLPISWTRFGTLYSRNITSDPQTGVGAWSDAQLERAIRSGISRDGRALHWQAMTWDQLSNLDPEDLAAVIAYLRALPPIHRAVHPPVPPDARGAARDCDTYTFYLTPSDDQVGCR